MAGSALVYDALVVGCGPAGLTAALQLARFNRHVAAFDSGMGRSTYHQINHNYLGFPGGIGVREFRDLARKQVAAYPVAFMNEAVVAARREEGRFTVETESGGLSPAAQSSSPPASATGSPTSTSGRATSGAPSSGASLATATARAAAASSSSATTPTPA